MNFLQYIYIHKFYNYFILIWLWITPFTDMNMLIWFGLNFRLFKELRLDEDDNHDETWQMTHSLLFVWWMWFHVISMCDAGACVASQVPMTMGNEALCFVEHWKQRNEEHKKDVFAFVDVSQTVTRMPTSLSKTKAWGLGWVVGVTCRDSRSPVTVIDLSYLSLSLFVIYDAPWSLMMSSEWVRQYEDCCGICSWWFVIGIISVVVAVASPASNSLVGSSNHTPRLQAMACRTGTAFVGPLQLQLSAFFQFNVCFF